MTRFRGATYPEARIKVWRSRPPAKKEAGVNPALCPQLYDRPLAVFESDTCLDPSFVSRPGSAMERRAGPSCDDMFVNRRIPMPVTSIDTDQIVITASRAPEEEAQTPAKMENGRRGRNTIVRVGVAEFPLAR